MPNYHNILHVFNNYREEISIVFSIPIKGTDRLLFKKDNI